MHSHAIFLPVKIDDDELRRFVETQGGEWQHRPPRSQGVWNGRPRRTVILSAWAEETSLASWTEQELAPVHQALGGPILGVLTLRRDRGPLAGELARGIIEAILARWGGYEIDCGG